MSRWDEMRQNIINDLFFTWLIIIICMLNTISASTANRSYKSRSDWWVYSSSYLEETTFTIIKLTLSVMLHVYTFLAFVLQPERKVDCHNIVEMQQYRVTGLVPFTVYNVTVISRSLHFSGQARSVGAATCQSSKHSIPLPFQNISFQCLCFFRISTLWRTKEVSMLEFSAQVRVPSLPS